MAGELLFLEGPAVVTIAECLRARSARLERRWARAGRWLDADTLDHARRLCRRLAPRDWRRLLAVFVDAVDEARAHRSARWRARDAQLPRRWSHAPWLYVDPRGASVGFEAEFELARALGFANVGLLANVGPDLATGSIGPLERVLDRARALDLRIAVGVDFGGADPRFGDPAVPHVLARVLRTLGREASLGVLGARPHRLDRWLPSRDAAHHVHALIKLFLRSVGDREIVIPEIAPTASPVAFAGGALVVHGEETTREGDLVPWYDAADALRAALTGGDSGALVEALRHRPRVLHGAAMSIALDPDDAAERPSLAALVDHDPRRLALAYALLYAMPATPIVHHTRALATAPDKTLEALRDLNEAFDPDDHLRVRARSAPRGVCVLEHDVRRVVANLGPRPRTLVVDEVECELEPFAVARFVTRQRECQSVRASTGSKQLRKRSRTTAKMAVGHRAANRR